jgi:hypothetical protein
MKITLKIVMLLTITAFSLSAIDPVGTWKLKEQKSKLPPGGLLPLGEKPFVRRTMTTEKIGPDNYRTVYDDTDSTGQPRRTEAVTVMICDGQEHPWEGRGPGYTESCQQIDASTDIIVRKKDDKIVFEMTARVSEDGKVQTLTEKGLRNGKPFEALLVFEKQ